MSEHSEQAAFVDWARLQESAIPELTLLYAIPNGGQRNKLVAIKLKAEGVRPGVPDLCLPVARQDFHALYLETKWGDNTLSPEQKCVIERLIRAGNKVVVCYGCDELIAAVKSYLGVC